MSIDPKSMRILLVEDAATMRKIEKKTLKGLGFIDVIEAGDGNEAVAVLESDERVNLVISDWNMPNKNGLELLAWIRASDRHGSLPFVMATGQGDSLQKKTAEDAGVSAFVAKPFNGEELKEKIDMALGMADTSSEDTAERGLQLNADKKLRLRVAHIQITDHLVLGMLKHQIATGTVVAEHFELETQCLAGWNPVEKALEDGTIDAACILAPIAMDLFSAGTPIKLVLLAHKNGSIFVRGRGSPYESPYRSFFENKTFFIPHKMSVHHMLTHLFFSRIGLKPGFAGSGDVNLFFEVCPPIKMPELLGGNPDAAGYMVAEPLGTKAIAAGIADLQFLSSELWENHPCCVVVVRDELIEQEQNAVRELTRLLVQAGKLIEQKPDLAASVAVEFLDPAGKLGLKVPVLKNVLTEAKGIKTADLYPCVEDLAQMQRYMHDEMGIGSLIDLRKFIDSRFADVACGGRDSVTLHSNLMDSAETANALLEQEETVGDLSSKTMLGLEGKYLTISVGDQPFAIDVLTVREITGLMSIKSMPRLPLFYKGVINLRGDVIPVMDLRLALGMQEVERTELTCIVVVEIAGAERTSTVGVIVDAVSEVVNILASDLEPTPEMGSGESSDHILGMAKRQEQVVILLNLRSLIQGKCHVHNSYEVEEAAVGSLGECAGVPCV